MGYKGLGQTGYPEATGPEAGTGMWTCHPRLPHGLAQHDLTWQQAAAARATCYAAKQHLKVEDSQDPT